MLRLMVCIQTGTEGEHPMFEFSRADWEQRLGDKALRRRSASASEEFVPFGGAGRTLGGRVSIGEARRRLAAAAQGQE